ncbi:hypothetical protein ACLB2K_042524 [Fragaria x ananassa]
MALCFLARPHVQTAVLAAIVILPKQEGGRTLPKFGEWDVNDPASAEGFTVIFNKARADKKNGGSLLAAVETSSNYASSKENNNKQKYPKRNKWLCMGC